MLLLHASIKEHNGIDFLTFGSRGSISVDFALPPLVFFILYTQRRFCYDYKILFFLFFYTSIIMREDQETIQLLIKSNDPVLQLDNLRQINGGI